MTPTATLFPGQGSLTPDSAERARAGCPELVDLAVDLLGGADPFERADESTAFAQPATFLASCAGWRERAAQGDEVVAMAGHSLGELSALAAAGALPVEDALWLVVTRGHLMAEAAAGAAPGGMIALLGGDPERARLVATEYGLTVANDNAPGQLVLSGPRSAVDDLARDARSQGFKALALDVRGAFHSSAVAAARDPFFAAAAALPWTTPAVPVVSCLTAEPFADVPRQLADALVAPVRWREVMEALYRLGARSFVDVGPGRVLERLVARNLPVLEEHALAG